MMTLQEYIEQIKAEEAARTEELCAAFLSEHGCKPSEAVIVRQTAGSETRIFVRKLDLRDEG